MSRRPNTPEDFWAQVARGEPDACWPWLGYREHFGHGRTRYGGRKILAHRLAYELHHGGPPSGWVCHTCDNPPCCNPAHLYDGDGASNNADRDRRGRTVLVRGEGHGMHVLTEAGARDILARAAAGERKAALAAEHGVSASTVSALVNGHTWRHLHTSPD